MGFMGYRRRDGGVGVRNHVVVMASVSCANAVVQGIGRELPELKTVTHSEGCGRGPIDLPTTLRTLGGVASHPNAAAVVVVGLGCETLKAGLLAERAEESGKPVEFFDIQDVGGTPRAIAKGVDIGRRMLAEAAGAKREEFGFEQLTLALECGGSDSMSGVTANPCVGVVADWLVAQGGRAILSEITEFLGTEEIVAQRCVTAEVREKLLSLLTAHGERVKRELGAMAKLVISPGNAEGGLSSIAEKSLGCIQKGGSSPIRDVIGYAEPASGPGLVIMNTPGGSPAGSPIAPVVKIASSSRLFEAMPDDMDFDAGRVMGGPGVDEVGAELIDLVVDVANGKPTRAELNRSEMFAIHTMGAAF